MDKLEQSLMILERRGVSLSAFITHASEQGLPAWHVKRANKDHWFHTSEEVDEFGATLAAQLGHDLVVVDADDPEAQKAESTEDHILREEFHEIHGINRQLRKLKELGFALTDLVPAPRIAGREPPIRYILEHGESRTTLPHLRALVTEIRRVGEKGLTITRFKGLGEMDPEELWATTLDPAKRTLLQVTLIDADAANKLFRTLMGEEVEQRRNFIFEKGINVKDQIDYGA
jgi:DNA gyrase subunit B